MEPVRILLVDDSPEIHEDFNRILKPLTGPTEKKPERRLEKELFGEASALSEPNEGLPLLILEHAYQGREALDKAGAALAENRPYGVAFVDVRMPPGMDGIDTVHGLFGLDRHLQAVICSAYSDYSWDDLARRFKTSDRLLFVKKPFDAVTIKQAALSLAKKWELDRQNRRYLLDLEAQVAERTRRLTEAHDKLEREMENLRTATAEKIELSRELHQIHKMESIGRLASGLTHDLNNVFGTVSSYADLIRHCAGTPEKVETYAGRIREAAKAAEAMVRNMLQFSRTSTLEMEPVDLHGLLKGMLPILEHTLRNNILITPKLTAENPTVYGNGSQLLHAVMNLVLNARDAMPEGGTITLETRNAETPGVELLVRDTGTGMSREVMARIFDPFFTTKTGDKGTGLGLDNVRRTIELHRGRISVESALGAGTLFRIFLPSEPAPAA